jgi:NSS family neurotransmitter:Na+ symporter
MMAELALGRRTQRNPIGAFKTLFPQSAWWVVGALAILASMGILSFYSVIAGWTIAYIGFTAAKTVSVGSQAVGDFFDSFTANVWLNLALTFSVLAVTASLILGGVRSGIERWARTLMPLLIGLLIVLGVRALTLAGAAEGLAYYFKPEMSKLFDIDVLHAAMGQAFFSLSLGMGCMITYGSYLSRRESIAFAAAWIVVLDTAIALLAGFIIFPSGFTIPGFDPTTSGPGLIFEVLPRLFATLPGGNIFGAAFFILLAMVAVTSSISLLEVPVSYLIDERRWSRRRAVLVVTGVTFLLAVPCVLSRRPHDLWHSLPGLRMDFLSFVWVIWNDYALPVVGLFICIFVGHVWKADKAMEELLAHNAWFPRSRLWGVLIRYVCPVAIVVIIVLTPFR